MSVQLPPPDPTFSIKAATPSLFDAVNKNEIGIISKWEKRPGSGWQQLRVSVEKNGDIKTQLAVRSSFSHILANIPLIGKLLGKETFGVNLDLNKNWCKP